MKVMTFPQRSEAWYAARRGLPTCSRFDAILTPKTGKPSASQDRLINELIAESKLPAQEGVILPMTDEMEYGMKLEAEARCSYELEHTSGNVTEIGFVLHDSGLFGGSPDALVGNDGGVEIKCPAAHTHIGYVRGEVLPDDYKCQVHGHLIVTGRPWWDFFSYCRHFDPFLVRVVRDDFTAKLESELMAFCERYNAQRVRFGLPTLAQQKEAA